MYNLKHSNRLVHKLTDLNKWNKTRSDQPIVLEDPAKEIVFVKARTFFGAHNDRNE